MAQNIYDDPDFFARYRQLPRQRHGLSGTPEWPAVRRMLPELSGKRILDLGCGFGWFASWAAQQGAASVLGVDISEKMIQRARVDNAHPVIQYRIADLEILELPSASFDLAYSSLSFHYVKDFGRLLETLHHSLIPASYLIFTIEHPIYMAATRTEWFADEKGRKTWPVNRYSIEGERRTDWLTTGVLKYHRTVATTTNTLIATGFELRQVGEFAPTAEQIAQSPNLADEVERPMFLLISAKRV